MCSKEKSLESDAGLKYVELVLRKWMPITFLILDEWVMETVWGNGFSVDTSDIIIICNG